MTKLRKPIMVAIFAAATLTLAVFARADYHVEKTLKLAPGGQFVLNSDVGGVSVIGGTGAGAKITITANRDDVEDVLIFNFDESAGMARVTVRKKDRFQHFRHLNLHFEVRVPKETRLTIHTGGGGIDASGTKGDAEFRTSGGGLDVSGIAGKVDAETSGGGVRLREITGDARVHTSGGGIRVEYLTGSLEAGTSGGPIRLERVDGNIRADTSGGPIEVQGAGGHVVAKTSGGSVTVAFNRGNGQGGELETSGGSIHVAIDPAVNLNLDASASGGGVKASLPLTITGRVSGSSLRGTIGKGGETLRLHTSGGSIHIDSI